MTLTSNLGGSGRPGVFQAPAPQVARLERVRLDVAGFVGVALRGPVDVPVLVARWSDYEDRFGAFERSPGGPERLLPHAVSAFFRQGGRLAYVLRVAPHGETAGGDDGVRATARFRLPLPGSSDGPLLAAADEGVWGNGLQVRLRYDIAPRVTAQVDAPDTLRLPAASTVPVMSLLRIWGPGMDVPSVLRWVKDEDTRRPRGTQRLVRMDRPLPVPAGAFVDVEVVTAALDVDDRSAPNRTGERLVALGLRLGHPRFLPAALAADSKLLRTLGDWSGVDLAPSPSLSPVTGVRVADGADRSALVDRSAFFDPGEAGADPLDEDPHVGVDRMGRVPDLGLLCVPDLTWRSYAEAAPSPAVRTWVPRQACCTACDPPGPEPDYDQAPAVPSGLDPRAPGDLEEIVWRQRRAVDVAVVRRRFVALIDVPDGLSVRQVSAWRATFDTGYCAAYHPWLAVADGAGVAVAVPPSAFAAGIVAERELRLGLPWGPANELARDAVRAESLVTDDIHDTLHQLGINVFRQERDGFRLTAGRTLSSDPEYRQLSVRRLMTMLRLALERQTQWLAFEPNTAELRQRLTRVLTGFLRGLQRQGAFAGASEAESFFVNAGDDVNPPASLALGHLVAEVGVAPSTPLEYILVRIARDTDGSLSVVSDEG